MSQSIVIDATHLGSSQPTGVERYADLLIPRLSRELSQRGVRVLWVGHGTKPSLPAPAEVAWVSSPYRSGWSQRVLPSLLRELKADAYFTPTGIPPLGAPCKTAMTVHDLAVYHDPDSFSWQQRYRLGLLNRMAARRASLLIVPSAFVAGSVGTFWGVHGAKIRTVPHGWEPDEAATEAVEGLDPEKPLVLCIGRLERKKNLTPLLKGLAYSPVPGFQTVLAGKPGFGYAEVESALVQARAAGAAVVTPGFVTDGQRRYLYEKAAVVVVPGLQEGFGLPVLEAFAYHVPCICAESGSLPEVGGEAVVYVADNRPETWRQRIEGLVEAGPARDALTSKGTDQLSRYTWEAAAAQTADAVLTMLNP